MDDYYIVEEASDEEYYSASEEEEEKFDLLGIYDDDEDFEAEMVRERESSVQKAQGTNIEQVASTSVERHCRESQNDVDDEVSMESNSNDALLYDPNADGRDEKWVSQLRQPLQQDHSSTKNGELNTDATLNCPFCMSLLCLDCQRHEIYKTQYRAMFVFNCFVDYSQKMEYKGKWKRRKHTVVGSPETYYAVKCAICGTQIAVHDRDEVYHFFNVLSSFP